jgi:hypothetical protein
VSLRPVVAAVALAGALGAACATRAARPRVPAAPLRPEAVDAGEIRFASIDPPAGTVLSAGQRLHLRAVVDYTLAGGDEGALLLVVHDDRFRQLATLRETPITRGSGRATLEADVRVPRGASRIVVMVPLTVRGYQGTKDAARQDFEVR